MFFAQLILYRLVPPPSDPSCITFRVGLAIDDRENWLFNDLLWVGSSFSAMDVVSVSVIVSATPWNVVLPIHGDLNMR